MRGVPAYWQKERKFPKSNPVCRVSVTNWTKERAVEELKRARKLPVIRSSPMARVSEQEGGEIAPVRAVSARGTPAASKEERDSSLTVEWRDFPVSGGRKCFDLIVILKE